jgi:hypothetical protein
LVSGLVSVAPANAGNGDIDVTVSAGTVTGDVSDTVSTSGIVGGSVRFTFTSDGSNDYQVSTDGKSQVTSASSPDGTVSSVGTNFANGANWDGTAATDVLTVRLSAAAAGSSVVTVYEMGALKTAVATLTVTWAAATATNLASASAYVIAAGGGCSATTAASTISWVDIQGGAGVADLCVVTKNAAGTAFDQGTLTNRVAVATNGLVKVDGNAVAVANIDNDGGTSIAIDTNGLSGAATMTVSVTGTNNDLTTTTVKTATASLKVGGDFTSIKLANAATSIDAETGAETLAAVYSATDKDGIAALADLDSAARATSVTWYVESDKGTTAVSATSPTNGSTTVTDSSDTTVSDLGVVNATAAADGLVKLTTTTGKYEKLSVWVTAKNIAGTTITSNKITVYASNNDVKSLLLNTTTSATGGVSYTVQALTDPVTTGTAYPVLDGETVTFGASGGVLSAATATTGATTGLASVTFYPPALGSSVILYASTGTGATLVTGSKTITNTVTTEISSLTTLVNSLIAKINALNKLVIKIQKKVRA